MYFRNFKFYIITKMVIYNKRCIIIYKYYNNYISFMENLNKILIKNFEIIISKLKDGTSYLNQDELENLIELTSSYADNTLSKYQAAQYLNVSTKTFDNYIKNGYIPKGVKLPGHKELYWKKKDIDNYIKKYRAEH